MKLCYVYAIVSACFLRLSAAQGESPNSVSTALNNFALNFLAETCKQAQPTLNLALSPYTVWNIMAIMNEGARKNTEKQLEKSLGIPPNGAARNQFRDHQRSVTQNILKHMDGISLEVLNSMYIRSGKSLNLNYQEVIQEYYKVDVASLNFDDSQSASKFINNKLSSATRGRLNYIVNEGDLLGAQIFVTSALFFKGLWDQKFNISNTKPKPFYDERRQMIGRVDMMFNEGIYPLAKVLNDRAFAVELPYKGGKMSMIILLPLSTPVETIASMLAEQSFPSVLEALNYSAALFGDDPLKLYMPRFKISSDLNLNFVLYQMGIRDIFEETVADLSGISPDGLFLSRVIHKAEIEVDEEGTVASAVAIGDLQNKITATEIIVDRPFLYFIYDKEINSIVFMGKYSFSK